MATKRILLTGAGSGGHVYPLIAVASELQELAVGAGVALELHYLGVKDRWSGILKERGIQPHWILGGKLRRYASGFASNLFDIPKLLLGLIQALWKMFWLMPDALLSKGGPGALPVVWAAWFYRVPILIHESDAAPGLTTALSASFARQIALSFETAGRHFNRDKVLITGNPVRGELFTAVPDSGEAKEKLGFSSSRPLLVVLGGSQGSARINEFILVNLPALLGEIQILHQTGSEHFLETEKLSRAALRDMPLGAEVKSRYQPLPLLDDSTMKLALAAADVIVGRAGSSTLSEAAAFGKPVILVPLPESANDHQRANAYAFAEAGGGTVIEESNLLPAIFLRELKGIMENPDRRENMQRASKAFFRPDAAEKIAAAVWEMTV